MSYLSHRLAEAANNITNLNEAAKTSPQEDEFLTDLTKAQIAAISPLMKSKDWNRLKAYLVSQKMVDKDFNDIKGYKMDRDVLSVLQRSFKDYHEQVEQGEEVTEGALNNLKVPAGVNLPKIIGGTQEWRGVDRNTNTKQSVVTLSAEIKKIASMVGNPDPKTIDLIAKALIMNAKEKLEKKESVDEARTNNTGTPTPVRLGKGRPAGAMTPAGKFRHEFEELTNDNHHGAAALLLAKFMGNSKDAKCIELVNRIHEIEGSIPHLIQQYRDGIVKRLCTEFDRKYPAEKIS